MTNSRNCRSMLRPPGGSRPIVFFACFIRLLGAQECDPPQRPAASALHAQVERLAEADRLEQHARQMHQTRQLREAGEATRKVLEIRESLLGDHPDVARTLDTMSLLLAEQDRRTEALTWAQRAWQMREKLYPPDRFPLGHHDLAIALNRLGLRLVCLNKWDEGVAHLHRAVEMLQQLYPEPRYPRGQADLATSLFDYGHTRWWRDKTDEEGITCLARALAMRERLYPREEFPEGHAELADSLDALGCVYSVQRDWARGESFLLRAQEMYERLYPPDRFPDGNPAMARSLLNFATLLGAQEKLDEAVPYLQRAADMHERLFPASQFPRGTHELADSLASTAALFLRQGNAAEGLPYQVRALATYERLYPADEFPNGDSVVVWHMVRLVEMLIHAGRHGEALDLCCRAVAMESVADDSTLGFLLQLFAYLQMQQGEFDDARRNMERSLRIHERLYPTDRFPNGSPRLISVHNSLGILLFEQGEYSASRRHFQRAFDLSAGLYPESQYPDSHPQLIRQLTRLAAVLEVQHEFDRAESHLQRALQLYERQYPPQQFIRGHPDMASTLGSLGRVYLRRKDYEKSRTCFQRSLDMLEMLYPPHQYPDGHPALADGLDRFAMLLALIGEHEYGLALCRRALDMAERLYPQERFPAGHPQLASILHNTGGILLRQEKQAEAGQYFARATTMYQLLSEQFFEGSSVAEALNYAAQLPLARDGLLSVTQPGSDADAIYALIWRGKAAISRAMAARHRRLAASSDPEVRNLSRDLIAVRRELEVALFAPYAKNTDLRRESVEELTERKESLERLLAKHAPQLRIQHLGNRPSHRELVARLSPDCAVVDFLRYIMIPPASSLLTDERLRQAHYVAFILRRDQPVVRVELGPAQPIEAAIAGWRQDLESVRSLENTSQELSRRIWQPIAPHLADVTTVLISPDDTLTAVPWGALPDPSTGDVLLERFAFGLLPHGSLLLGDTELETVDSSPARTLLTVGGVRYGAVERPESTAGIERPAVSPSPAGPLRWPELPATRREAAQIAALVQGSTAPPLEVVSLTGTDASAARLIAELPRARWVHLATHGVFADPGLRSDLKLDEALFQTDGGAERLRPAGRSPQVLSGIVMASGTGPARSMRDRGIVTAEAISSLPLHHVDLVVLSACDTGTGEVAGGEGCFGLQRAFNNAGARTVIACMWKANDSITIELMDEFYRNHWQRGMGKLAALREAQLKIRRHGPGDSSHPRYWAGWTLSGDPGDLGGGKAAPRRTPAPAPNLVARADRPSPVHSYCIPAGLAIIPIIATIVAAIALVARWRRRARPFQSWSHAHTEEAETS